jgi:TolB-like protein
MKNSNFFAELKRRNVYKVAVAYIVAGWALAQGIAQVFPVFDVPNWIVRLIVLLIIVGFPVALALSWAFEITPEGLKRTEDVDPAVQPRAKSRAWIYIAVVGALLSIGLFFLGRFTVSQSPKSPGKSIAVLPFVDMSQGKDQEYFCDGISEEILDTLAKVEGLRVVARTSSFSFKGRSADVAEVATKLNVATVLEGSLRRNGNRIRISAQLIARDGFHLWSETYDRELQDVFAMQDEITRAIVDALKIKLALAPTIPAAHDTEAHDFYLQGLYFANKSDEKSLRRALVCFQHALGKEPTSAPAWIGIAATWS